MCSRCSLQLEAVGNRIWGRGGDQPCLDPEGGAEKGWKHPKVLRAGLEVMPSPISGLFSRDFTHFHPIGGSLPPALCFTPIPLAQLRAGLKGCEKGSK